MIFKLLSESIGPLLRQNLADRCVSAQAEICFSETVYHSYSVLRAEFHESVELGAMYACSWNIVRFLVRKSKMIASNDYNWNFQTPHSLAECQDTICADADDNKQLFLATVFRLNENISFLEYQRLLTAINSRNTVKYLTVDGLKIYTQDAQNFAIQSNRYPYADYTGIRSNLALLNFGIAASSFVDKTEQKK